MQIWKVESTSKSLELKTHFKILIKVNVTTGVVEMCLSESANSLLLYTIVQRDTFAE